MAETTSSSRYKTLNWENFTWKSIRKGKICISAQKNTRFKTQAATWWHSFFIIEVLAAPSEWVLVDLLWWFATWKETHLPPLNMIQPNPHSQNFKAHASAFQMSLGMQMWIGQWSNACNATFDTPEVAENQSC